MSWRTARRAKDSLGIKPAKTRFDGGWTWALPAKMTKMAEDVHPTTDGHLRQMAIFDRTRILKPFLRIKTPKMANLKRWTPSGKLAIFVSPSPKTTSKCSRCLSERGGYHCLGRCLWCIAYGEYQAHHCQTGHQADTRAQRGNPQP
jgi:hypothetical protein